MCGKRWRSNAASPAWLQAQVDDIVRRIAALPALSTD